MSQQQSIPCPTKDCDGQIPFEAYGLVQGLRFVCPKCHAAIGLEPESRPVAREGLQKFETMKRKVLSMKDDSRPR